MKRTDKIKELIEKYEKVINDAEKGKVEINFSGDRTTISVTVIDE